MQPTPATIPSPVDRASATEAVPRGAGQTATRVQGRWSASSFDLAQGLEVKELESKLSPETLDELFRS